MRKTVVGVIAVVAASSVLSVVGLGLANASPAPSAPASNSALVSTVRTEAGDLQNLHDQLKSTFDNKDVVGMQSTAQQLATELVAVRGTATKAAMASDTTSLLARAQQLTGQLLDKLNSAVQDGLPDAGALGGGLLTSVTGLVSSLLATVMSLISSLLGGLPVPGLPVGVPVPVSVPGK
jgi:hypothetical protein